MREIVILYAPDEEPNEVWIVRREGLVPRIILLDGDDRLVESNLVLDELMRALGVEVSMRVIEVSPADLVGSDTWNWEEVADAWLEQQGLSGGGVTDERDNV